MDKNPFTMDNKRPFCFWTGSMLDTNFTKRKLRDEFFGPTTIQVMAGVLSGVSWMVKNKNRGLVFGEDLDDNYIIELAKPYLGVYHSDIVTGDVSLPGTTLYDLVVRDGVSEYVRVKDL